ncbi:histidine phosphatase family protein [Shewanella olleyana]|uniref:histidine phosphatase family protein n=1 Tax=Shewanella olleyana TaxID=135626 RepID=UPI00200BC1E6|nr:histidine phosphatase family protein [Shewanella olleyana]MCL1066698.1 histidine phosphatase family protein [Shewanella olleyana]
MKQAKLILLRHGQCEGGNILRGKTDVSLTPLGLANMQASVKKLGLNNLANSLLIFSSPLIRCSLFAEAFAADINQARLFSESIDNKTQVAASANSSLNQEQEQMQEQKQAKNLLLQANLLPQLKEVDFGDWDGQSFDALYQAHPQALDQYWDNPWDNTPPNGEPMPDFEARVTQGLALITAMLHKQLESSKALSGQDSKQESGQDSGQGSGEESTATALVVTHGGVIRHIIGQVLVLERCKGLYAQLAIDYAASVTIDVYWPESQANTDGDNSVSDKAGSPEAAMVDENKQAHSAAIKPVYRLNWPS